MWKGKRVLVTGASGFIGSHLTEELVGCGASVRAMIHYNFQNNWGWLESLPNWIIKEIEVIPSDVCDPFAVSRAVKGMDSVFHLAALIAIPYSYIAPASYVETNVLGTLNVLEACREHGTAQLVHTSTSETYGTAQYVPIDEKHPLVGQSPYSASKIAADKLVESYHLSFELPVSIIRPFNTFGPRQSARAVIPTVIIQALSGAKCIHLGLQSPVRDFNFVADTVSGFLAVAENKKSVGRVTNIGSGHGVTIGGLANTILKLTGSDAEIVSEDDRMRPEHSEVMSLICNNSQAKKHLGWTPKYTLEQGLEKTIRWMEGHLRHYKASIYNI